MLSNVCIYQTLLGHVAGPLGNLGTCMLQIQSPLAIELISDDIKDRVNPHVNFLQTVENRL